MKTLTLTDFQVGFINACLAQRMSDIKIPGRIWGARPFAQDNDIAWHSIN
jgi:hypothetical protein